MGSSTKIRDTFLVIIKHLSHTFVVVAVSVFKAQTLLIEWVHNPYPYCAVSRDAAVKHVCL